MSTSTANAKNSDQIPPCPACGCAEFRHIFVKKGRHFWRCESCNLERQFPLPTPQDLKSFYDNDYADGLYKTFADASVLKRMTAAQRFKTIRPHVQAGKWLDLGASNGFFVEYAREHGIDAEGVELSHVAAAEAAKKGLPVHCAAIETYDPGYTYDTITGFDILEHVLDPAMFLAAIRRLLRPGGTFVLAVPNQASIYRHLMGKRWFLYIPEEHMFYYNPRSLESMLNKHGLEVTRRQRAFKPLSLNYSLFHLKEYNPLIYRFLSPFKTLLGERLADAPIPLYIGEMLVFGRCSAGTTLGP